MRRDGGWGWVIVAASFFVSFIGDGIRYSYGLLYLEFLAEFKQGKATTSWIGSIMFGLLNIAGPVTAVLINLFGCRAITITGTLVCFTGPVTAVLINTFGCRAITITGTLVCFTGYIISVFATSVYFLCLSMGILGGVGLSMMMLPINVIIVQYFNKKRSLAMGLALSGSGFGTIVFNPVSKWLIDEYGWRGTLLIEAGLLLNCGLCGLQMKPFTSLQPAQDAYDKYAINDTRTEESLQLPELHETGPDTLDAIEDELHETGPDTLDHIEDELHETGPDTLDHIEDELHETGPDTLDHIEDELHETGPDTLDHIIQDSSINHIKNTIDVEANGSPIEGTDLNRSTFRSSTSELATSHQSGFIVPTNKTNTHEHDDIKVTGVIRAIVKGVARSFSHLKSIMGVPFVLFLLNFFILGLCYDVPFTFIPDLVVIAGHGRDNATWLMTTIGISNTIGRLTSGMIADCQCVYRPCMMVVARLLIGVCLVLLPFSDSFVMLMCVCVVLGYVLAAQNVMNYLVFCDLFGDQTVVDGMGLMCFTIGISSAVGVPFSGFLFDITGTYYLSFITAGSGVMLAGLLIIVVVAVQWLRARRK